MLEAGNDCQTQRGTLDKADLRLESSDINQTERVPEARERGEDDINAYLQPIRINRDSNDLTSDMTWLTTAQDGSKWDSIMESDTCNDHHHQTPRTDHAHDSKAHDQDEGGATNKTTTTHYSSPPK